MGILKTIRMNMKIISAMNSCDHSKTMALVDEVINQPEVFRKKRYVWNIVRDKEFYKTMAHYVIREGLAYLKEAETINSIQKSEDTEFQRQMNEIINNLRPDPIIDHADRMHQIIRMVMETAKTDEIKKSFIYVVTRELPMLTEDTIKYISPEKIENLLMSDKILITDQVTQPFVDLVVKLRIEGIEKDREIEALQTMIE